MYKQILGLWSGLDGKIRGTLLTDFVYSSDESLRSRIAICRREEVIESRGCDYTRHDALIVSEENEACRCHCRDCEGKRAASEAHESWRSHFVAL